MLAATILVMIYFEKKNAEKDNPPASQLNIQNNTSLNSTNEDENLALDVVSDFTDEFIDPMSIIYGIILQIFGLIFNKGASMLAQK